jgi:hypothetical protein
MKRRSWVNFRSDHGLVSDKAAVAHRSFFGASLELTCLNILRLQLVPERIFGSIAFFPCARPALSLPPGLNVLVITNVKGEPRVRLPAATGTWSAQGRSF